MMTATATGTLSRMIATTRTTCAGRQTHMRRRGPLTLTPSARATASEPSPGGLNLSNASPEQLAALDCLTAVDESLTIQYNKVLVDLTGLEGVTSVGADLTISNNDVLVDLIGLHTIAAVGGDVHIYNNDSLVDLSGLENTATVGGDLHLHNNYALVDLSGLDGLSSIGGKLHIYTHSVLIDVSALENVASVGLDFNVSGNWCLETAAAEAVRDAIGTSNIGGTITIVGNTGPCK
jgi:hypothetical protein